MAIPPQSSAPGIQDDAEHSVDATRYMMDSLSPLWSDHQRPLTIPTERREELVYQTEQLMPDVRVGSTIIVTERGRTREAIVESITQIGDGIQEPITTEIRAAIRQAVNAACEDVFSATPIRSECAPAVHDHERQAVIHGSISGRISNTNKPSGRYTSTSSRLTCEEEPMYLEVGDGTMSVETTIEEMKTQKVWYFEGEKMTKAPGYALKQLINSGWNFSLYDRQRLLNGKFTEQRAVALIDGGNYIKCQRFMRRYPIMALDDWNKMKTAWDAWGVSSQQRHDWKKQIYNALLRHTIEENRLDDRKRRAAGLPTWNERRLVGDFD